MRRRILMGTVLLTVATIAAFFIPAAVALSRAQSEAQAVELQQEAAEAAARLAPGSVRPSSASTLGPVDDDGGRADQRHEYARYGADGRRIAGKGPERADAAVLAAIDGVATTARVGDERVAAVPLADGGAVRAAEPASEADDRTRSAVLSLAAIATAIVIAASAAAWLLARRLTVPLRQLGTAAARLGGGDFTATAPITGISEIDEVAVALNASAERIGDLVEREQQLTADTSHQLRTPITGLRVALETELAAPRPDPTALINEALGAVDRLELTVDSLTDLARGTTAVAPFDLAAMADAAAERWTPHYRAAGRSLRVARPDGASSATRRAAIDTIIDVLIENALAHGRGGVTLSVEPRGATALVSVTDEGTCTVAADRLFERHESGSGSSGIGLHLARSLAEAEGARLRLVHRDPTSFQLQLPLAGDSGEGHHPT